MSYFISVHIMNSSIESVIELRVNEVLFEKIRQYLFPVT